MAMQTRTVRIEHAMSSDLTSVVRGRFLLEQGTHPSFNSKTSSPRTAIRDQMPEGPSQQREWIDFIMDMHNGSHGV